MAGMGDLIGLGVLVVVVWGGWTLLQSGALNLGPSSVGGVMTPIQTMLPSLQTGGTGGGSGGGVWGQNPKSKIPCDIPNQPCSPIGSLGGTSQWCKCVASGGGGRTISTNIGGGGGGTLTGGSTAGYNRAGCNYSGYKGTPGWYTISGHHHCFKGQSGCVCTDPKKCYGVTGTGSQFCRQNPMCCQPGPNECAWWYAADHKDCSRCQPGTAWVGNGSGAHGCG